MDYNQSNTVMENQISKNTEHELTWILGLYGVPKAYKIVTRIRMYSKRLRLFRPGCRDLGLMFRIHK